MGLKIKLSAVTSLVAVTALSIQGLSPSAATEPDAVETPAPAAATSSGGEGSADTPPESSSPTPEEPQAAEEPVEPEAPKLADVTIGDKTSPINLGALTLPLNLGSIDLNPQSSPASEGAQYGGGASGAYARVNLAGLINVTSSKLGGIGMKPDGGITERSAAILTVPPLPVPLPVPDLNIFSGGARGVVSRTVGSKTFLDKRPVATSSVEVARLDSLVYFAYVGAGDIKSTARVELLANGQYKITGDSTVASLEIAGIPYQTKAVAPNTSYAVPGLGKVVLNEQKVTQIAGDRHGIEVHAIHITLETASLGLPVGADIYVGSSEAILYE